MFSEGLQDFMHICGRVSRCSIVGIPDPASTKLTEHKLTPKDPADSGASVPQNNAYSR